MHFNPVEFLSQWAGDKPVWNNHLDLMAQGNQAGGQHHDPLGHGPAVRDFRHGHYGYF
jgi:hypothetical protein